MESVERLSGERREAVDGGDRVEGEGVESPYMVAVKEMEAGNFSCLWWRVERVQKVGRECEVGGKGVEGGGLYGGDSGG